jgi:hypothetical protein
LPGVHAHRAAGGTCHHRGAGRDVGSIWNNTPVFKTWDADGQTPNDISYFLNGNLLPVSVSSPAAWKAGANLNSLPQIDYQGIMGQAYRQSHIWYELSGGQPAGDNGSGGGDDDDNNGIATYAVVGLVGIKVTQADASGGSMTLSVHPCAMVDPTAVIANPFTAKPAGTQSSQFSGAIITTFSSAKLTQ